MAAFASVLAILGFLAGFQFSGLLPAARLAIKRSADAGRVMRDKNLSDAEKESLVQKAALAMMGSAGSIAWRFAACFVAALAPIYVLSWLGAAPRAATFAFLARWDVIALSSVVVTLAMVLFARLRRSTIAYSLMDRTLHRLAFAAPFVQMTASDIEDSMFAKPLAAIKDQPPIFVTALPRAGTTVMLNALHELPGLATHLYRDMPFVMAPLLWARLSGAAAKTASPRERAHGDGLMIGYDSPEAFEEVIWRAFWPQKYHAGHIDLWTGADARAEATSYFRRHFRKIALLRCGGNARYLSKNNGNIARLGLLHAMFPDAKIVVPLREPMEHAASLLRQHRNFLEQHRQDAFVQRYMRDIGHYEFGALHRPIAFPGFAELANGRTPDAFDYWLAYWIAAHRHIAEHAGNLIIVPQQQLAGNGAGTMQRLCAKLGLDGGGIDVARHFHAVPPQAGGTAADAGLSEMAADLYQSLQLRA